MNIPVKYASQHVHVKDNLVHTQLPVASACVLGFSVRGQRRDGQQLALMGHPLIYRRLTIFTLLFRKLEHVVICRSQVLLFKSQEMPSVCDELFPRVLEE